MSTIPEQIAAMPTESLERLHAEIGAELVRRRCIGNDPLCPCNDSDACHYRDLPGSPAMPLPSAIGDPK